MYNAQNVANKDIFWEFERKLYSFGDTYLMKSSVFMPFIIVVYLLFVLKIGPAYMKNRQPFKLNKVLIVYNIIQVAVSCYIVAKALNYAWKYGLVFTKCNLDKEENVKSFTYLAICYITAKLTELLDTVFFVLRKKQNQVTFLHVYHHVLMASVMLLAAKFDLNENGIFLGLINSFVHIIMYGYYCLSAIPNIEHYLWWKKYITKLQLIQFALILIHIALCFKYSACPPSIWTIVIVFFNGLLFIYLFSDFYIKSYIKSKGRKQNEGLKKKTKTT